MVVRNLEEGPSLPCFLVVHPRQVTPHAKVE